MNFIKTAKRFSDLQQYVFIPKFPLHTLVEITVKPKEELRQDCLILIHPFSAVSSDAMNHVNKDDPELQNINPDKYFKDDEYIVKDDADKFEANIKKLIISWAEDKSKTKMFKAVIENLDKIAGSLSKLIDALKRGIGVHHASLPRKYLGAVEILFRKRHLSIVIATGTLALGINMSGRSGRRDYDLIGHLKAVSGLFVGSFFCLGKEHLSGQIKHHLRFSIEYLIRENILDQERTPINLSGMISHLYYAEPSNFAMALYLNMVYFMKKKLRHVDQKFYREILEKYPSKLFLPKLPEQTREILEEHNERILKLYTTML
ncbi:P-loop containing nucleoside triphosphate hydrolase protein [Gigaspora margarita]|uniref:P-loop containing nucleoside triphosphate hydrolase protein n=1 Tax=Gigaspora margarita TaxID=4874 RepID=A0A8H4AT07_GIGMA|nr:P-loop containing nucleoside triphosphate hydrolase protein [Gigaspora margarita]